MARFFTDDRLISTRPSLTATAYAEPRAMVGSAERLNLSRHAEERVEKRPTSDAQTAAWNFMEMIGEISAAFSLIGNLISRCRIYPAIVIDRELAPVDLDSWLEGFEDAGEADTARKVADKAHALLSELVDSHPGRESGLLRNMAVNFSVPGEIYLVHDEARNEWLTLSTEELTSNGTKYQILRSRTGGGTAGRNTKKHRELPEKAFAARMWRPHPRWGDEPTSSVMAVLDQAQQLVLLDQVMRAQSRRALNAGLIFLPDGISAFSAADEGDTLADSIARSALAAVERETAVETVTPKVIQGPPDLGDKIKHIILGEPVNEKISDAADKLLDRILAGLDIPADIVKGLADVKYANGVIANDALIRDHIEPLLLLIVDSLTTVYLRPLLKKGMSEAEQRIADRIVLWGDTAPIVIRPDQSAAADWGYTNKVLNADAWREARGFGPEDAPDEAELLRRLVIDRAPIPQDMAVSLLERFDPDFFKQQRTANQAEAGFPDDISSLLSPDGTQAPQEAPAPAPAADQAQGGPINPNGTMPPQEAAVPRP